MPVEVSASACSNVARANTDIGSKTTSPSRMAIVVDSIAVRMRNITSPRKVMILTRNNVRMPVSLVSTAKVV